MKERAQSALGTGIGCAVVAMAGLIGIGIAGLLALAFPVTLSIVISALAVLGFLEWRRRRRSATTGSARAAAPRVAEDARTGKTGVEAPPRS